MRRRKYLSASAALLTASVAGCSQSSGEATPTENSTRTATDEPMSTPPSAPADSGTPTDGDPDGTQLQYDGDALTLENAPDQEIRGTSDLSPGSALEISLDSETASDPFIKRPTTTVQDDGAFSATVDMSDTDEGTEFTVSVVHDDETLTEVDGRVA